MVRSLLAVSLLVLLSACAGRQGGPYAGARWDGRRGYDGHGDYGYDLDAPRAEAATYRVGREKGAAATVRCGLSGQRKYPSLRA